uniref:Uncharacterized protein n=1 Tax=Rhizophora mucronata TaxID=61149 RepID=A0A2P2KCX7_RHIMU
MGACCFVSFRRKIEGGEMEEQETGKDTSKSGRRVQKESSMW